MSTSKQLGARDRNNGRGREGQPAEVRQIIGRTMEGEKDRKKSSRKVKEGVCCGGGGGGGGRLVSATSSHHHREIPPTSLLNATSVLDVSGAADTKASISERQPLCETSVPCVRTSSAYTLGGETTTEDHCAAESQRSQRTISNHLRHKLSIETIIVTSGCSEFRASDLSACVRTMVEMEEFGLGKRSLFFQDPINMAVPYENKTI